MAAMDFGMAVAAGIVPKAKKSQEDLINLAGGRDVFKSEGWWNKQIDKQISEGYREQKYETQYKIDTGLAQYFNMGPPTPSKQYIWKPAELGRGGLPGMYGPPRGAVYTGGMFSTPKKYETREVSLGYQGDREDFTAGELTDIEKAAKRGAETVKRTAAESKASKRRLSRATGGLIGKAMQPGQAPATGMPALGEGGLGITGSILGGGIKL
jgi:hypothetical protein